MIVDTSAIVAIVRSEPERDRFSSTILGARCHLSAATWLEVAIVVDSAKDATRSRQLDELIAVMGLVIEPVTAVQARIAREAYRDFGRASGHPARLNFGDCFAYALAKDFDMPLLFKGNDFSHTDVRSALPHK